MISLKEILLTSNVSTQGSNYKDREYYQGIKKGYFKIISVSGYFWVAYWNLAVSLSKGRFPQSKENKLKTFSLWNPSEMVGNEKSVHRLLFKRICAAPPGN